MPYRYPLEWVSCAPGGPCWAGGNQLVDSHSGFASALLVTPAPGRPWQLQPGCPARGPCSEPVTDVGSCPVSTRCYAVNNSSPFVYGSTVGIYSPAGEQGPSVTVPANAVINDIACPAARACYTAGAGGAILRTTNGTTFAPVKTPARKDLDGITCVTASVCYAVGAAGTILARSLPGGRILLGIGAGAAQLPVAANQAPVGEATNTMGAMHGRGSVTLALISAFPLMLAGNWPVVTLATVAMPPLMLWQLTMASKWAIGLMPCRLAGTMGLSARTRPRTCICSRPSLVRIPVPAVIIHGSPPPGTMRIGLPAPT